MLGERAINQSGMEDVARPCRNRAALSFSMELSPHSNGGGRVGRCCSFVRLQRRARRFILCVSAMIQSCGNVHAANIPTLVASVVLFVLRRHGVKAVGDVTAGPSGTGGGRMTASAAERTPLAEACHGGMLGPAAVLIHRISPCNPRTIYSVLRAGILSMASNKPQAFNPPSVPEPPPTYRQVCVTPIVSSSSLVTLAGQTGLQKDGTVPAGIRAQAKAAYESIHKCLEAAGATPRDIVRLCPF